MIHPAVEKSQLIPVPGSDVTCQYASVPADLETRGSARGSDTADRLKFREWSHNLSPTQVKLVELLQFVIFLRKSITPLPVAVIVSAWDLVRDPVLPVSWLENHLPLLSQFLAANADTMPSQIYGISALGGDLVKDLERLRHEAVPSRRIKVFANKLETSNDLTAPIGFLLNQSDESSV